MGKSLRERITILEVKIDEEFLHKILDSFALYTDKLGEIHAKLEEMGKKIIRIETKIFR